MSAIIAYIGHQEAYPILMTGLKRLEFRGYDSTGIAIKNDRLKILKTKGKISELEAMAQGEDLKGHIGIGHIRWATHGEPNTENAHPHLSHSKNIALIHNGIIENYASLRAELQSRGYTFRSDTDTEVLVNLIEDIQKNEFVDLFDAVRIALNQVVGAYAIVVMSEEDPDCLIAARKGGSLLIGVANGEYFIASDPTSIIGYTKNVVYLDDEEVACIRLNHDLILRTIRNQEKTPYMETLEANLSVLEKGGYEHFMLKEIFEQPNSIHDSMRGRLHPELGVVSLGGILQYEQKILNASRIIMMGCGTSWHACLVGEYLFEDIARIPVEVEYASEFRYRNPIITENDVIIAISQSGETADTIAAMELAKKKGATILGICNVVGSSIARMSHAGSYTHAGPEIGIASTKAFTAQVVILILMALRMAQLKGTLTKMRLMEIITELSIIPDKVEKTLQKSEQTITIATEFKDSRNFLYLGRGYNFPVALEGALKLKEISYIHAEGYPAAEIKHGPIALIDKDMPVVILATNKGTYEKILSNIQEVKARKGRIIAIVNEGDTEVYKLADYVIEVPDTEEVLSPLLTTIPLQLLAYHIAVLRGCNVDQPRNLSKSVTVE
ncbi:MAG: glutamine--fructose-6-phosphate transaminase (isomerizing) [Bacteroidales bacterium]|jgi:glucosamine--fructose-6-phosphate aminotransferase (isomerizing)|nr:glutamine--fructose-6-phosphate transaminase (isomerizing) [Bacteroidales bacterium]MDD3700016.1 glutamine--fructose-6-phosphate transaminase (isomerizing) [Bacteroidales bacterium]MDY0368788.1 glutamine--fructose-6-phosphate transaminase (isomerizing) [Bacteroidales bacterium]